jgi:signal transduction histidine kinase
LTPIKGYAGVLARRKVSHQQAVQFAGEISAGVDQLERVITQLVDFASMAAGRLTLNFQAMTARDLLADVSRRWRPRLPENFVLTTRVARDTPDALVDAVYLQRCFDELIDNAVKYSPQGGRIAVAAQPGPLPAVVEAGASVRFTVTDEGLGLDPEEFERLLGDFSQADASVTREFGGLGLGLTLVDRVVRAHEGHFGVERAPGGGSRFVVTVRAASPPPAPGDADGGDPAVPTGSLHQEEAEAAKGT